MRLNRVHAQENFELHIWVTVDPCLQSINKSELISRNNWTDNNNFIVLIIISNNFIQLRPLIIYRLFVKELYLYSILYLLEDYFEFFFHGKLRKFVIVNFKFFILSCLLFISAKFFNTIKVDWPIIGYSNSRLFYRNFYLKFSLD